MTIRFGFCLPIFAAPGPRLFRTPANRELDAGTTMGMARHADALGYDSLWVADHLMLGKDDAILEGWTTLAALAGMTSRAQLGLIHQANLLRHPAMAAKMAATLDQVSGGRFIYFLDPGANGREHQAYGLPWSDDHDERVARMVEGLELSLALWTEREPVSYAGRFYRLDAATCAPRPLQSPHPPIWIGATTPAMYAACARFAQGWNTTAMTVEALAERLDKLAAACEATGRCTGELEKSLEIQVLVAPDRSALRQRLKEIVHAEPVGRPLDEEMQVFLAGRTEAVPAALSRAGLAGTPDEVAAQIGAYLDAGITHFLLWFLDAPRTDGLELFAAEVAPRFRG